jgi:hypothetical protein
MLVTLADMKTYLGIGDASYDTFLTEQLEVVSSAIEHYCRRKFDVTNYVQTFYNWDYPIKMRLDLFMFPMISLTSIVEDGDTLATTEYVENLKYATVVKETGFFRAKETVLTYQAGHATIPTLLQNVVKELVETRYNKKTSGVALNFGSDVQRVSIPGTISIDFDYSLSNNDRSTPFGVILGSHLNILDIYKSERSIYGSSKIEYVVEV